MSNTPTLYALGAPFPYADTIQCGGDVSPGQCHVIQGKRPSGWDERKGYGLTGATLWPIGDPLGHFAIRFDIWDEDDWGTWLLFYKKYFAPSAKLIVPPNPGPFASLGKANVLTIVHPVLAQLEMQECVVIDRDAATKDDLGLWSQTVYFKAYRKPKPALQPSTAVIPGLKVAAPPAQTQLELEIQKVSDQLNGTAPKVPGT